MLSTHILRKGRLFHVGMSMENISPFIVVTLFCRASAAALLISARAFALFVLYGYSPFGVSLPSDAEHVPVDVHHLLGHVVALKPRYILAA